MWAVPNQECTKHRSRNHVIYIDNFAPESRGPQGHFKLKISTSCVQLMQSHGQVELRMVGATQLSQTHCQNVPLGWNMNCFHWLQRWHRHFPTSAVTTCVLKRISAGGTDPNGVSNWTLNKFLTSETPRSTPDPTEHMSNTTRVIALSAQSNHLVVSHPHNSHLWSENDQRQNRSR